MLGRRTQSIAFWFLVSLGPGLSGCLLGPDSPPGPPRVSERFAELGPAQAAPGVRPGEPPVDFEFWRELGDPLLVQLVEQALAESPDVARATARIREARAVAGAAWASLFPELRGGASYERLRLSTESPLLSRIDVAQFPGFVPDANDLKASLQVAYELDLWGKNRRARESALQELRGDVERRQSIGLSLAAEVTLGYVDVRTLEARRAVAARTLGSRNAALQVARDRERGGLGSELEVLRAEVEAANTEAQGVELDRQLAAAEHRLSVLVGMAPGSLLRSLGATHPRLTPFSVPVGLPAQLLTRRPDLRELSARLWAATARIGQAKAELFPQLVLQGELGVEAVDPSTLAKRAAGYWTAGPSLVIPLFDWGRRSNNWTAAEERAEQALHDLERQVLVALEEVEDALSNLREGARHRGVLERAAAGCRRGAAAAEEKYTSGLVAQLEVLDAQREQYQAEDRLAEADGQAIRDAVSLAKAVAGGVGAVDRLMPRPAPPEER